MLYYQPPQKQKTRPGYLYLILALAITLLFWFVLTPETQSNIDNNQSTQILSLPTETDTIETQQPAKLAKKRTKHHFVFKTAEGDTLSTLFDKAHLSNKIVLELLHDIKHANYLKTIKPKQTVSITTNKDNALVNLSYQYSLSNKLIVNSTKDKKFISKLITLKPTKERHYLTATVEQSLYTTGIKQKIPHTLLVQLAKIFARSINFSKDVRNNDRFTIVYQTSTFKNEPPKIDKILAARYVNKKNTYTAINYKNFNKHDDYFTPEGRSLKLGFDRFPVKYTHISSHFDPKRMHPILKINRPHRGIDLAAMQGTEIHAVADGKVSQIGPNSGYGNMIKITHSSKYETVYAHMVRFKNGLTHGSTVKRGDIIGYVGQTGLATAPHCHFEFRIFGKQVDPATTDLPSAPSVSNKTLLSFKKKTQELLEQLALYESASTASES